MNRARLAIEKQYKGTCNVIEYKSVKDSETTISKKDEVTVLENQPCKLSYENLQTTGSSTGAAEKAISTKLFIAPEVVIKAGSKIVVTQDGVTTEFKGSGEPGRFTNHQEINLKLFDRWV